ncbi:MAG: radical SAM protein, partial [Clostridia bacterium]|nr:radical SAM protein [Clostridia bacterium]
MIPYLRGRSRSRNPKSIIEEIKKTQPKEAVLNGINLSAYDYNGTTLTGLIESLKEVDCRIRLGSLEVGVITDEFLTALKNLKNFAPHFHLSLQSGSNAVLKKMNRHYTAEEYANKVDLIRKYF